MRPLEFPKENSSCKPLLQRMADEKRFQMERGSIGGSYFIVQLQDGSMEKRMKMPINIDPGVHSSFCLNELGTPLTPVPTMPVLPTITEAKAPSEQASSSQASSSSSTLFLSGFLIWVIFLNIKPLFFKVYFKLLLDCFNSTCLR